jgi:hypothetical protein
VAERRNRKTDKDRLVQMEYRRSVFATERRQSPPISDKLKMGKTGQQPRDWPS